FTDFPIKYTYLLTLLHCLRKIDLERTERTFRSNSRIMGYIAGESFWLDPPFLKSHRHAEPMTSDLTVKLSAIISVASLLLRTAAKQIPFTKNRGISSIPHKSRINNSLPRERLLNI